MRSLILACVLALLAAGAASADDPPTVDILAALHLEPRKAVDGLAYANSLPCTVREGSPLEVVHPGDAVFLSSLDRGAFRVVPDTGGVLACCVGETVNVLDFLSPRRALLALGLEPSDEPIADGDRLSTRVVDPERLAAHGVTSDGIGDLVSVYGRTGGRWSISTFGREHGHAEVDVWALYRPRAPVGELLERATVELDLATLWKGGRLLALVADAEGLRALGIRYVPADTPVVLERGTGSVWTLTLLAPGFTVVRMLDALDPEALGLAAPRLLDLPVGGTVRGRVQYRWKAEKAGIDGFRGREPVELVRRPDGAYRMRSLAPRRTVSVDLPRGA